MCGSCWLDQQRLNTEETWRLWLDCCWCCSESLMVRCWILRARAGNLWGPYIFFKDDLFIYFFNFKSNLAKNVIIYCHSEFPPLGGAVINESMFWLITPKYLLHIQKPYIQAFSKLCWFLWFRPRPFPPPFSFSQILEISQT